MKGKIKRAAKSLMRWRKKNHMEPEKAMKALINRFNRVFLRMITTNCLHGRGGSFLSSQDGQI